MNERKIFDPNKARRKVDHSEEPESVKGREIENIDFSETMTQGMIFRSLQDLEDLLKGATTEDCDKVFGGWGDPVLQKYINFSDQMSMNLKRIIENRRRKS